jgi:hypothetical protein
LVRALRDVGNIVDVTRHRTDNINDVMKQLLMRIIVKVIELFTTSTQPNI